DGAPAPARPSGFYAIRRATLKKGQPPCRAVVVDEAHGLCILEEQPDQPGWQLIRARLTIGGTVVEIASREARDPDEPKLRHLARRGGMAGGGKAFGLGSITPPDDGHAELDVLLHLTPTAR